MTDMAVSELPGTFSWTCHGCGGSDSSGTFACSRCGEPLALRAEAILDRSVLDQTPQTLWHYHALLPIESSDHIVSLGEGATPLLSARRLGGELGLRDVRFKNEMLNPTGSFKDRQVSVGISHAREIGADTVAVVSSGNVAASTAAYAARAGMRAVLFMHAFASPDKMAQAAAYGATIVRVDAPPSRVFDLCIEACTRWGWQHLSTAGMYEPWNVEGAKTIAYELFQQYEGNLPDWIIAPVGGGGLLGGIWRGFLDLQRMGVIEAIPRLTGVQAAGCAPLTQAIDEGTPFLETLRNPWPNPQTIAGGIADDILFDGHTVLPAIRTTGGRALSVTDEALVAGIARLAKTEGLLCELTTGVVVPALEILAADQPDTRVCVVLTGNGLKDLNYFARHTPEAPGIPPDMEALSAVLGDT